MTHRQTSGSAAETNGHVRLKLYPPLTHDLSITTLQTHKIVTMAPLTAAEIVKHPAYDSVAWNLPPTTSGTCPVAQNRRGGPLNLYYEIHGTGPAKLVVRSPLVYIPPLFCMQVLNMNHSGSWG